MLLQKRSRLTVFCHIFRVNLQRPVLPKRFVSRKLRGQPFDRWEAKNFELQQRTVGAPYLEIGLSASNLIPPKWVYTLPETNIAPETRGPLEEEIPKGHHHFKGEHVSFREGNLMTQMSQWDFQGPTRTWDPRKW